jgi:hypothetical protein
MLLTRGRFGASKQLSAGQVFAAQLIAPRARTAATPGHLVG